MLYSFKKQAHRPHTRSWKAFIPPVPSLSKSNKLSNLIKTNLNPKTQFKCHKFPYNNIKRKEKKNSEFQDLVSKHFHKHFLDEAAMKLHIHKRRTGVHKHTIGVLGNESNTIG